MINIRTLRTGLAAVLGAAILLAGLIAGASVARADDDNGETVQESTLHHLAEHLRSRVVDMCGRVGDVADKLDLDLEEFRQRISEGTTLQEFAAEADLDLETILDALRDRVTAEIDERIENGSLNQERGDRLRERIESFHLEDLSGLGDFGRHHRDFGDLNGGLPFGGHDWLEGMDLDIDLGELRAKLESGMSLEEALSDLGFDLEAALAEARASALAKIDELVDDGTLSEERAGELREMIENFSLESGFPFAREFRFDFGSNGDRGEWRHSHVRRGSGFGYLDEGTRDDLTNGEGVLLEI